MVFRLTGDDTQIYLTKDRGAGMRYVMRIFDTPLLEFEASYGEGLQAG